jgi:hypothetical protein
MMDVSALRGWAVMMRPYEPMKVLLAFPVRPPEVTLLSVIAIELFAVEGLSGK